MAIWQRLVNWLGGLQEAQVIDPRLVRHHDQLRVWRSLDRRDGWQLTPTGLAYRQIGGPEDGQYPRHDDRIKAHMVVRLSNGRCVQEVHCTSNAQSLSVAGLIPGLREGVQLMPVRAEFEFAIQPALAHGFNPYPGVPPPSLLLVQVQLLGIVERPSMSGLAVNPIDISKKSRSSLKDH